MLSRLHRQFTNAFAALSVWLVMNSFMTIATTSALLFVLITGQQVSADLAASSYYYCDGSQLFSSNKPQGTSDSLVNVLAGFTNIGDSIMGDIAFSQGTKSMYGISFKDQGSFWRINPADGSTNELSSTFFNLSTNSNEHISGAVNSLSSYGTNAFYAASFLGDFYDWTWDPISGVLSGKRFGIHDADGESAFGGYSAFEAVGDSWTNSGGTTYIAVRGAGSNDNFLVTIHAASGEVDFVASSPSPIIGITESNGELLLFDFAGAQQPSNIYKLVGNAVIDTQIDLIGLGGGATATPVPEPNVIVLLWGAFLAGSAIRRKRLHFSLVSN